MLTGFPCGSVVKYLPANAEDAGDADFIPESGRSLRERNGNPLQYSCLENPMDKGDWQATVHGVAQSDTTEHIYMLMLMNAHTQGAGDQGTEESGGVSPLGGSGRCFPPRAP